MRNDSTKRSNPNSINSGSREHNKSIILLKRKDLSDKRLIKIYLKDKDTDAFEELVNRYSGRVYRITVGIMHDHNRAEDILREVFLTVAMKLNLSKGNAEFSTWLYRITVNTCYMYLRADKKILNNFSLENYATYNQDGALTINASDEDWSERPDIYSKEALWVIERAVKHLPGAYRLVFQLRDIEGLSISEVSEILELSIPVVKSRLHRARLFLREILSEYFNERRNL